VSKGYSETNRVTGLFQGLGPIIVTLIAPSHYVDWTVKRKDKVGANVSKAKKSWRGRGASSARKATNHRPLFSSFLSVYLDFTLHFTLLLDLLHIGIFTQKDAES
jgi:hypothetical protein